MDADFQDSRGERRAERTGRRRWWLLAYGVVVGAVAGACIEVAVTGSHAGLAAVEPVRVVCRAFGMAVTIPLGIWLSGRLGRGGTKPGA